MLKLLPNIQERLRRTYFSMIIFYAFFLVFTVIIPLLTNFISGNISVSFSVSPSFPSGFYAIGIGVALVTAGFNSSIQFGSSRKTIFSSYMVTAIVISLSMLVINSLLTILISKMNWIHNIDFSSKGFGLSQYSLGIMTFDLVIVLVGFSIGIFMGLLIKRLSKQVLLTIGAVLIFMPTLFFYVIARLSSYTQNQLRLFVNTITGIKGKNIWALIITLLVITIILNLCSWLIIRRQPAK